jgi:hypothetical protein
VRGPSSWWQVRVLLLPTRAVRFSILMVTACRPPMQMCTPLTVPSHLRSPTLWPTASATYSYMTIANFKSLVQIGTKMRAYGVSTPELYMECTADAADMNEAWTTDKNWQISDSCTISTSCTQSYTAPNRGFVYSSGYDTINPACGNSVFTKENAGTYSNGWHRSHSDDGGGWTSTYADRMVYIVK